MSFQYPPAALRPGDPVLVAQGGTTYQATLVTVDVPNMQATVRFLNNQTAQVPVANLRPGGR